MSDGGVSQEFTRAQVLAMELAAARAWPAVGTVDIDGWTCRCSGGGTRRANSVLPLTFAGADADVAIARVEALYAARGQRAYFQVSAIAAPADLDDRLARRGYAFEEPVLLLAKNLTGGDASPTMADVEVSAAPSAEWLAIYAASIDAARRDALAATLARVPDKRGFFVVRRDGLALASALCVISPDGIAIVECVATDAARRRSGAAQLAMTALESWAATNGAGAAALQVVETNTAARALYDGRGYRLAGRYHYRWREVQTVGRRP